MVMQRCEAAAQKPTPNSQSQLRPMGQTGSIWGIVPPLAIIRTGTQINVPIKQGIYAEAQVIAVFGAVVAGRVPGRLSAEDVTVFDSTGIALQDSATVPLEYERAIAAGVGIEQKMISV